MVRALLPALALIAACKAQGDDYPVLPGGGGGGTGGGTTPDAAVDAPADGGTMIAGRVCLLTDVRDLTSCAATGAGGLTVTLGIDSTVTAGDGTFLLPQPFGSNLVWTVSGTDIMTSAMPYSAVLDIPAISATTYADLLLGNGVLLAAGEGGLMARVVSGGSAVAGATVTGATNDGNVFYDGSSASIWNQGSTGAFGTVWIPQMVAGTGSLSVTPSGGSPTTVSSLPITDGGITFVVVDVP
jgi:hypothetical protein